MWSQWASPPRKRQTAFARVGELATRHRRCRGAYAAQTISPSGSTIYFVANSAAMREAAESFLREMESKARPNRAGRLAHRCLGNEFSLPRRFRRARSRISNGRFDITTLSEIAKPGTASARIPTSERPRYLAHAVWRLGDIGRARELINEAERRAADSAHVPTLTNTYIFKAIFEVVRDDAQAASRPAEIGVALSREHGLEHYSALGLLASAWTRAKLGDRDAGSTELRQALADYIDRGETDSLLPLYRGRLGGNRSRGPRRDSRPRRDR